jgi:hypothetical protein
LLATIDLRSNLTKTEELVSFERQQWHILQT